jgi:SEC-C motif-containing protein
VLKDIDFLINTSHSSCNAEKEREQILEAAQLDWVKLEIVDSKQLTEQSEYAFVEFKAWYMENSELHVLHERSRFTKETIDNKNSWRYLDGIYPEPKQQSKTGRNDPCPCKSGKKFKKCCA